MHHVFKVDEILRLISICALDGGSDDVVSFACCCKSFSGPALDTIWGRYYPRLTRLLRTFPPTAWTIVDEKFDFVRQPSEEEWKRFSVYAKRIRHLMDSDPIASEAALRLLNARFSNTCMLPNLREIRWQSAPPEHLDLMLPLIVSPVLTSFRLGLTQGHSFDAPRLTTALKHLAPAYHSLTVIFILDLGDDPSTVDALSALLFKLDPNKLRFFHAHSALSEEAFIHVSQFPNLRAFSLKTDAMELRAPLPLSMFPSLESLDIYATNTRSPLLNSFKHIQSKAFSRLTLEFPAATLGAFLPRTFESLRSRGLHRTLTNLSIYPEGRFDVDTTFIRQLLFLERLTNLVILSSCGDQCPFKLTDEDLEELVRAMPKLKSLSFGCNPCSHPPSTTVKSLVAIAKHCKCLKDLIIHINAQTIIEGVTRNVNSGREFPSQDSHTVVVGCPLRNMMLGPCPIPAEELGARILALTLLQLFPHLSSVTVFPQIIGERFPQWDLVNDILATHSAIGARISDIVADMGG